MEPSTAKSSAAQERPPRERPGRARIRAEGGQGALTLASQPLAALRTGLAHCQQVGLLALDVHLGAVLGLDAIAAELALHPHHLLVAVGALRRDRDLVVVVALGVHVHLVADVLGDLALDGFAAVGALALLLGLPVDQPLLVVHAQLRHALRRVDVVAGQVRAQVDHLRGAVHLRVALLDLLQLLAPALRLRRAHLEQPVVAAEPVVVVVLPVVALLAEAIVSPATRIAAASAALHS